MPRSTSAKWMLTFCRLRRKGRAVALAVAVLPVCQATGCFPDPIGALNFELQSLINVTLINAFNTIILNLFNL
ncbi:MAG TPA: hypothetical protein VJZ71_17945 [Phycisphaerae bacterium]|nr:hypothetical protein [Phycisphaerae bacterium]